MTLTQAQVGKRVRVVAVYTDALGNSESVTSTITNAVANVADVGLASFTGAPVQGQTLDGQCCRSRRSGERSDHISLATVDRKHLEQHLGGNGSNAGRFWRLRLAGKSALGLRIPIS